MEDMLSVRHSCIMCSDVIGSVVQLISLKLSVCMRLCVCVCVCVCACVCVTNRATKQTLHKQ